MNLGQAGLPSSYCRSWYRLVVLSIENGGHSWPWQNGGPSLTVGSQGASKLISLPAEIAERHVNPQNTANQVRSMSMRMLGKIGFTVAGLQRA